MKKQILILLSLSTLVLTSCGDRPFLYSNDDVEKPAYSQTGAAGSASAESRAPLDVPPSLRNVEVPQPENIATKDGGGTDAATMPERETVAGKSVSLDAKLYGADAAAVFSSVIDAMTSLNLPVQSVDSPSGTVTTDWIRQDANRATASVSGLFGGTGVQAVRYRFVVRTLRQVEDGLTQTRLEIRTIGQAYISNHWVNRPMKRKVSEELFHAVEERLRVILPQE